MQLCPCQAGHAQRIQTASFTAAAPRSSAARAIPHLPLAGLQFQLSSWKRRWRLPAHLLLGMLSERRCCQHGMSTAPRRLRVRSCKSAGRGWQQSLRQAGTVSGAARKLLDSAHLVREILGATIVCNQCENTFLLLLIELHLPLSLSIWKPRALCVTHCSHPSEAGEE